MSRRVVLLLRLFPSELSAAALDATAFDGTLRRLVPPADVDLPPVRSR